MPCRINGCTSKARNVCPLCQHWEPSRTHRYYYCARYRLFRIVCDLPSESCLTCDDYDAEDTSGLPGRPNISGIDWTNEDDKKQYFKLRRLELRLERVEAEIKRLRIIVARLYAYKDLKNLGGQ